jgi:beta-lactamase class A
MQARRAFSALRLISIGLLLAAVVLTALQLVRFSRVRSYLPAGLMIAGVPVGGLDRQEAAERLLEFYAAPVDLYYDGARIRMDPTVIDFQLDLESMLAIANLERTQKQFWQDFWDYLWGRAEFPTQIPLSARYSESRLKAFLSDIATRYDQPAQAAVPSPVEGAFQPGRPGKALDDEASIPLIEASLYSLGGREVNLPLQRVEPERPSFDNLRVLLKQTLQINNFEGLAGVYLLDLQSGQEHHFAYRNGEELPVEPDVALTASSTIKIPIMVSAYRRMQEDQDPEAVKLMEDMIEKSGNEAADWLMDRVIDEERGPLLVSSDMQALGLKNTFLAGYFTAGSPLLALFETPANLRTDVFTDPDPYSQTTTSDLGMLLTDIYQCSQTGGGTLVAVFPGEITQAECQNMITHLINNRLPVLLTAGLPEATPIAHKHGWVTTNGVINTIGDAGIVYSPGGNYVLVVFLNNPDQLIWETNSALISQMSQAVYNYYNLPQ